MRPIAALGDEIQIGAGTTLEVTGEVTGLDCQVSRGVPALAVDEDEHVVWAQATKLGLQGSVRRIEAEGLGSQRRHDCRERLDEVRLAGGSSQYLGAQYLNGRCTVCSPEPGLPRAGHDDFFRALLMGPSAVVLAAAIWADAPPELSDSTSESDMIAIVALPSVSIPSPPRELTLLANSCQWRCTTCWRFRLFGAPRNTNIGGPPGCTAVHTYTQ